LYVFVPFLIFLSLFSLTSITADGVQQCTRAADFNCNFEPSC